VGAEVAERVAVGGEGVGAGGDEGLAAVPGGSDTGGAVDVDADITVAVQERLTSVDANPDPDRPLGESLLDLSCGGERVARASESAEGVALGVDLDASVGGDGFADDPSVLGERPRIGLWAEVVQ
jgi:hypothetical protein